MTTINLPPELLPPEPPPPPHKITLVTALAAQVCDALGCYLDVTEEQSMENFRRATGEAMRQAYGAESCTVIGPYGDGTFTYKLAYLPIKILAADFETGGHASPSTPGTPT